RYCDALCAAMMTQFLYRLSCSFRLSVAAVARNCARELHNVVRRYARAVRTAVVRLGDECVRLSFERRGAVLCTDPPALVDTPVVSCCYLRAGCCRTVCLGWCKTSGKVQLVECTRRCRFRLQRECTAMCERSNYG